MAKPRFSPEQRSAAAVRELLARKLDTGPRPDVTPGVAWGNTVGASKPGVPNPQSLAGMWGNTVRFVVGRDVPPSPGPGDILLVDGAAYPLVFVQVERPRPFYMYLVTTLISDTGAVVPPPGNVNMLLTVDHGCHKDSAEPEVFSLPVNLRQPTSGTQATYPMVIGARLQLFVSGIQNKDANFTVPAGYTVAVTAGVSLMV